MKLTDMKRSKKEREARNKGIETCAPSSGEEYGYGLTIRLDEDDLKKLGLKPSSFDVGDDVEIEARGTIKALRQEKGRSFDSSNVEIQITSIGIEPGSAAAAISKGISDADDE